MSNVTRGRGRNADEGSTLVEALVATLVLTTGLLAMAELVRVAAATNVSAHSSTVARILAEQKLEQLRALTWEFDVSGAPVSDSNTETAVFAGSPTGGTGLNTSPGSLRQNTSGFVDYLDAHGAVARGSDRQTPSAAYIRRWSVEPLAVSAGNAVVIPVLVTRNGSRGRADQGSVTRLPDEARLVP